MHHVTVAGLSFDRLDISLIHKKPSPDFFACAKTVSIFFRFSDVVFCMFFS